MGNDKQETDVIHQIDKLIGCEDDVSNVVLTEKANIAGDSSYQTISNLANSLIKRLKDNTNPNVRAMGALTILAIAASTPDKSVRTKLIARAKVLS